MSGSESSFDSLVRRSADESEPAATTPSANIQEATGVQVVDDVEAESNSWADPDSDGRPRRIDLVGRFPRSSGVENSRDGLARSSR